MAGHEKITVADAIVFYQGEIRAVEDWLEKFRDGKPSERRGSMDIMQHEEKLRFRTWTLKQLEKSL